MRERGVVGGTRCSCWALWDDSWMLSSCAVLRCAALGVFSCVHVAVRSYRRRVIARVGARCADSRNGSVGSAKMFDHLHLDHHDHVEVGDFCCTAHSG